MQDHQHWRGYCPWPALQKSPPQHAAFLYLDVKLKWTLISSPFSSRVCHKTSSLKAGPSHLTHLVGGARTAMPGTDGHRVPNRKRRRPATRRGSERMKTSHQRVSSHTGVWLNADLYEPQRQGFGKMLHTFTKRFGVYQYPSLLGSHTHLFSIFQSHEVFWSSARSLKSGCLPPRILTL